MKDIKMSRSDLADFASHIAEDTTSRVLQELGLQKKTISYSEIRNLYGRTLADKARMSTKLKWIIGGGRGRRGNEKYTNRSDFEKWLFSNQDKV